MNEDTMTENSAEKSFSLTTPISCPTCGFIAKSKIGLGVHMKRHTRSGQDALRTAALKGAANRIKNRKNIEIPEAVRRGPSEKARAVTVKAVRKEVCFCPACGEDLRPVAAGMNLTGGQ